MTETTVLDALREVKDPDLHRDVVELGFVKNLTLSGGKVTFNLELTTPACPVKDKMKAEAEAAVMRVPGVTGVEVTMTAQVSQRRGGGKAGLPGIKNIVAVSACKGGVGKSTVAVNLAVALARSGAAVGLMDADVYGPNVPLMLGVKQDQPRVTEDGKIIPYHAHGVTVMSIGLVMADDTPLIWRGPMVHSAVTQFLRGVEWGTLDYLIIDLPPGTGDAQLTLVQTVPLAGAVVVTTPQEVALLDGKKGVAMFQQLKVPVLGIVENMSGFTCPHCRSVTPIFSVGGGQREAERLEVPFLGAVPLDAEVRSGGDSGTPIVLASPNSPAAQAFTQMAGRIAQQVSMANLTAEGSEPVRNEVRT